MTRGLYLCPKRGKAGVGHDRLPSLRLQLRGRDEICKLPANTGSGFADEGMLPHWGATGRAHRFFIAWPSERSLRGSARKPPRSVALLPMSSCHQLMVVSPVTRSIAPSTVNGFNFKPRRSGACRATKEITLPVTPEIGMT